MTRAAGHRWTCGARMRRATRKHVAHARADRITGKWLPMGAGQIRQQVGPRAVNKNGGAPNGRRKTTASCYARKERRREERRTSNGDDVDDSVVIVRDTARRGTRDCGRSRERDARDDAEEDTEVGGVIFGELDALESLPKTGEDAAGTAPCKCEW